LRYFVFISLLWILAPIKTQFLDTSEGSISIRELYSKKELFVIDWENVYFQNSSLKVKEKLGSFHLCFKESKPIDGFTISKYDKQAIVWTKGNQEIQLKIGTNNSGKLELTIWSNFKTNHWHIPFKRGDLERIYGGGIQFSKYKHYNKSIKNLTQENGIGRGGGSISKWTSLAGVAGESDATYCPLPNFHTSLNRSFSWNDFAYSEVEFSNDFITFNIFDQIVTFTLGYDSSINEVHKINSPLPYELPLWSLGTILGVQGGTQEVKEKLNKVLDAQVKVNALWIQDWVGKQPTKFGSRLKWTWQLDNSHYPDFEKFKSELMQKDIKILGYVNPFFAEQGPYLKEGISNHYFIEKDGIPIKFKFGGIKGYMVDLFSTAAYSWMKQIIQLNLVNQGFSGWMADFGEWYPIRTNSENTINEIKKHNEYPVLWAKLNYEIIKENLDKELFFFNRSGGKSTQKYSSMMWAGDQMVDYTIEDGLGSVFDAYLSSAYSGLPIIHSDVGGYTSVKKTLLKNSIRKEKLLKDWMLLEAFTPVFRTHEGLLPEENIQIYSDSLVIQAFKTFSTINHALLPYFKQLIKERNETGKPIFSEIIHTIKGFETTNPGFCVGSQIMIIHQLEKEDFKSLINEGWKFVDNSGSIKEKPSINNKIIVAIKDLAELIQ
tara:strand:- start:532 stop:2511 length:1980 start_codon:yes stop_codon:yes gene_type:complete